MLAQYLVLLGAISSRKSKKKSVKAVNCPQIKKERTFHVHSLVQASASFSKNTFYCKASGSALFLIYP